jgi:formylglycine-generating enzyme required for sulfatase activity
MKAIHTTGWSAGLLAVLGVSLLMAAPGEEREFTNRTGMEFVRIQAGSFKMGMPPDENGRFGDEDQHTVTLTTDYFLGKYPVTRGQFRQFLTEARTRSEAERDGQGGWGFNEDAGKFEGRKPQYTWENPGFQQTDDHPVVNVTWNDADAFCRWLANREGRPYRLPTEAEWEYACRGGTTTRYFTGDQEGSLKGYANVADQTLKEKIGRSNPNGVYFDFDDGFAFTSPVGRFKPNPYGLHDMTGNVWQWCADRYGRYALDDSRDPKGPTDGAHRVMRGGSWYGDPRYCRCASRGHSAQDGRGHLIGFRIAVAARTTP